MPLPSASTRKVTRSTPARPGAQPRSAETASARVPRLRRALPDDLAVSFPEADVVQLASAGLFADPRSDFARTFFEPLGPVLNNLREVTPRTVAFLVSRAARPLPAAPPLDAPAPGHA